MVHLIELLLVISMTSTALALVVTPAPESMQDRHPETEYFSVQNPSCSPCPSGWVTYARRCFKYFDQGITWVSAETHCLSLGANLVSIHNENENQLVKALIRAYDPKEKPTWIGLSNCHKKNSWIWSDGTRFVYSRWNKKEPNHSYGECCVHMNWGMEKNWNDIPCNEAHPFVCVKRRW
ncbi:lactose-binding lectin l-2-like isoform X2 [Colossoma macropomum]|uniref:lactose-binding lectin l-2-like isoform X2 n=1 Tax=Colossoma macropomum TaxID=42526 RepID=UPI001864B157|nr:lactose-binding lectin l-2-like isoform X2 [Colossoma macropomum]